MSLTLLYRGLLSSCNYACGYCPFAKKQNTREQLAKDKADLERFVAWVAKQQREIEILFTPWGEALIRGYYRDAITHLCHMPHVKKVAIQTNFSCSTTWLKQCNKKKVAFWITYHPDEISIEKFITKCQQLDKKGITYSVGIVGMKEHLNAIRQCRKQLAPRVYLWINAYKREAHYYSENDLQILRKIDPHFDINNQQHPSLNKPCKAGETSISIDGDGNVLRCHFIKERIGNIYDKNFEQCLKPRLCSNEYCRCYIGYIHLPHLKLNHVYGERILERVVI